MGLQFQCLRPSLEGSLITIGTYAINEDDTCKFLAVDFDKDGWQDDIENIDYKGNRNIDKKFVIELATCSWIRNHLNILISGNAGPGKTRGCYGF